MARRCKRCKAIKDRALGACQHLAIQDILGLSQVFIPCDTRSCPQGILPQDAPSFLSGITEEWPYVSPLATDHPWMGLLVFWVFPANQPHFTPSRNYWSGYCGIIVSPLGHLPISIYGNTHIRRDVLHTTQCPFRTIEGGTTLLPRQQPQHAHHLQPLPVLLTPYRLHTRIITYPSFFQPCIAKLAVAASPVPLVSGYALARYGLVPMRKGHNAKL